MSRLWEREVVPGAKVILPEDLGAKEKEQLFVDGVPTRAAVLLYGEDPQKYFPYAVIELDSTQLVGTLFDQLNEALVIIPKIFKIERTILQELIANALIHRDYAIQSPIRVLYDKNILIIMNPGGLQTITVNDLENPVHPSIIRNPAIAYHFYLRKKIYLFGVGFTRVRSYLEDAGFYPPEVVTDEDFFKITIRRKNVKSKKNSKTRSR